MTDTTDAAGSEPDREPASEAAARPRSIRWIIIAIASQVGFSLLYAALYGPVGTQLKKTIVKDNNNAKNKKVLCSEHNVSGCLNVNKVVHNVQLETAVGTVILSIIIVLLARRLWNGTRSARTIYVGVSIVGALVGFAGSPVAIFAFGSAQPPLPRVALIAGAASSIAAIFLLFRSEARAYIDLKSPRAVGAAGRPGFGRMFSPRPAQEPKTPKPQPGSGPRSSAQSRAQARSSKAKSRNDAEAIARGAELARNRAKSSKSRRNDF